MKIKDSTIICLLILTWLFVFCAVMGAESEINRLEKQLESLKSDFDEFTIETTAELAEHDDRLYLIEHNQEVMRFRINNHYQKLLEMQAKVNEHSERITKVEQAPKASVQSKKLNLKITQKEIRKIGSLVYLECGSCSTRCKRAIASVVFNRMIRYKKTVNQIIYERGVFSVAWKIGRTKPSKSCLDAVKYVIEHGTTLPRRVTAFRNGHYHSFGRPYCMIDGVYFTYV